MSTKHASNGAFIKPAGCFTQVANKVLRDPSISLKAKGLYSLIVSYITIPGFTLYKDFLKNQCCEGRHAFDSAWKELVSAGYLSHTRLRLIDGTFAYQYIISDNSDILLSENSNPKNADIISPEFTYNSKVLESEVPLTSTTSTIQQKYLANKPKKAAKVINFTTQKNKQPGDSITQYPPADNLPVVYNRYNNTISKNTKSILSQERLIKLRDYFENKIDYNYFSSSPNISPEQKVVVEILLDFLIETESSTDKKGKYISEYVDSSIINEFLEHMKTQRKNDIKYPLKYWKKSFSNYIQESAILLSSIG